MKKLFDKIMGINAKKNIIYSIIICVIFCIVASIGVGVKFGSRIVSAKQQISTLHEESKNNKETVENNKHGKEKDENKSLEKNKSSKEDVEIDSIMNFGIDDYIFVGITFVIGLIVFVNYWLTAIIYVVQKCKKTGANKVFFGVLTLITNIIGILILNMYLSRKHICSKCGKIQNEFSDYCYNCGEKIKIKCPSCQSVISDNDKFCTKCGAKIE